MKHIDRDWWGIRKKLVLALPVSKCQYNQWSGKSWPCGTDMQSQRLGDLGRMLSISRRVQTTQTDLVSERQKIKKKKDSALTINPVDANIVMSIVEIKKTGKER